MERGGRREGSPSLLFLNSPILPQFYPPSTKILVLVLEGVEDALIIPLIRGYSSSSHVSYEQSEVHSDINVVAHLFLFYIRLNNLL